MPEQDLYAWLLRSGLPELQLWIASRLIGEDRVFPLDSRSDEDPDALFVWLVQTKGYGDGAVDRLTTAMAAMLDSCSVGQGVLPPWLPPFLRMCERIRFPRLGEWFLKQLTWMAEPENASWADVDRRSHYTMFLMAAARQLTVLPGGMIEHLWLALLQGGTFGEIPLIGLSSTFQGRIRYLASWWRHAAANDRQNQLRSMMRTARRLERADEIMSEVRAYSLALPRDVIQIISAELDSAELDSNDEPRDDARSISNALRGAGLRPDVLTQETVGLSA